MLLSMLHRIHVPSAWGPAKFVGRSAVENEALSSIFLSDPENSKLRSTTPCCGVTPVAVLAHEGEGPSKAERPPPKRV